MQEMQLSASLALLNAGSHHLRTANIVGVVQCVAALFVFVTMLSEGWASLFLSAGLGVLYLYF